MPRMSPPLYPTPGADQAQGASSSPLRRPAPSCRPEAEALGRRRAGGRGLAGLGRKTPPAKGFCVPAVFVLVRGFAVPQCAGVQAPPLVDESLSLSKTEESARLIWEGVAGVPAAGIRPSAMYPFCCFFGHLARSCHVDRWTSSWEAKNDFMSPASQESRQTLLRYHAGPLAWPIVQKIMRGRYLDGRENGHHVRNRREI